MNLSVVYVPHFELQLDKELIASFMLMSQTHYDAKCRYASRPAAPISGGRFDQGFINGWQNAVTHCPDEDGTYTVQIHIGQLDTLLKICENTSILDEVKRLAVTQFTWHCMRAVRIAQQPIAKIPVD